MGQGSEIEPEGQVYTLNLLERLHAGLRDFGQTKDELYWRIDALLRELRNPNLHEVELTTAFQIEVWDRHGKTTCGWYPSSRPPELASLDVEFKALAKRH